MVELDGQHDSRSTTLTRMGINLSADEEGHDGPADPGLPRRRRKSPRPSLPAMTNIHDTDKERLQLRQFGDLARILNTDKRNYGGDMYDVFDMELAVFRGACSKLEIRPQHYALAFSFMPRDKAADFYY
ncbi:hypothetical protein CH35J_012888 [Colletotrichum higginsianum]|uniref:Uncharacterized protein n=1 Tax=Colletotrichum higginsianum TaxID=80884 RepID=A0A4T0VCN7_9PEZI|nr:hypothetical protein CH35J_012888 [Colletotrichum higginsianum]